jgi:aerobic-type carbon monoxide dehydrogenase small subunit (CoxS/CutS family)
VKARLTLNGKRHDIEAAPMARLLDVLRETCGLTGTKEGCGEGECGACTVLMDGQPVNACLVPFAHADGAHVVTIEGLAALAQPPSRGRAPSAGAPDGGLHPLQRAFIDEGGAQCGFCTPGMLMAAAALPPQAEPEAVRRGLAGNLCRCTGYTAIYRAVAAAQIELRQRPTRRAPRRSTSSPRRRRTAR